MKTLIIIFIPNKAKDAHGKGIHRSSGSSSGSSCSIYCVIYTALNPYTNVSLIVITQVMPFPYPTPPLKSELNIRTLVDPTKHKTHN